MTKLLPSITMRIWMTLLALGVLVILARAEMLGGKPEKLLNDVRNDGPNAVGMDLITQNYYEELLKEDREPEWQDARLIRAMMRRLGFREPTQMQQYPETWGSIAVVGATIDHETGFLEHSLKPNVDVIHRDLPLRTNRWGHRDDKDYELNPDPGVFRIVVVGSSNAMAQGVAVEDGMMYHLERLLNETLPTTSEHERYEVINISVPRYHLLERVYVARHLAPSFHPHLMLFEVNMRDMRRALFEGLIRRIGDGRDLGFDFVREIVRRANVSRNDSELRIEQRLQRFREELVIGCFQELARVQHDIDIPIVPMILRLEVEQTHRNLLQLASVAESAGLEPIRVFDAYEGRDGEEMYLGIPDYHPSVMAHALLAEEIIERLLEHNAVRAIIR